MRWRRVVLVVAVLGWFGGVIGDAGAEPAPSSPATPGGDVVGAIGVTFEPNRGQFDPQVRFLARGGGPTTYLTADGGATYVVPDPKRKDSAVALKMRLVGGAPGTPRPSEQAPGVVSYFRGSDPGAWQSGIPTYGRVDVAGVYPGVDLAFHSSAGGDLEYDFVVAPGASTQQIGLSFAGAKSIHVTKAGDLELRTEAGTITMAKPVVYQPGGGNVAGSYKLDGGTVGFTVGAYDATKPLVIDPVVTLDNLAYSTLLGGVGDDRGRSVAVDGAGNAYVSGITTSTVFPATPGAFDPTANGGTDVFVTKVNAAGTALVFSTVIGGVGNEDALDLVVDAAGSAFVTGPTSSATFPTTAGAFDTTHNGGNDAFVTKLSPTGAALAFSTFVGGASSETARGIAVDEAGRAVVTGETTGGAFPVTAGALDTTHNGGNDVFVTKIAADGATLAYSTFLGGDANDAGREVALDGAGNVHIAGVTSGGTTPFPTTPTAFDTTHNGASDAFVSRVSADGTTLSASTFLGGTGSEFGHDIAVDAGGGVYVAAAGASTNFPTTGAAFDSTNNGSFDITVTKLAPTLNALTYSTYVGGSGIDGDFGVALAIDAAGNAYVGANTTSADFPIVGAFDNAHSGSDDGFVFKLSATGSALRMSTFLGSGGADWVEGVAVDGSGNVYATGLAPDVTPAFPTSPAAFQADHGGAFDAFLTKFGDFSISGRVVDENGAPAAGLQIALSGPLFGTTATDAQGWFAFTDTIVGGDFVVAPEDNRANPQSVTINNLTSNRGAVFIVDFQAPFGEPGTSDGRKP